MTNLRATLKLGDRVILDGFPLKLSQQTVGGGPPSWHGSFVAPIETAVSAIDGPYTLIIEGIGSGEINVCKMKIQSNSILVEFRGRASFD